MKNLKLIEKAILFAMCLSLPISSLAQAGSIDLSFGDSGIVTTNITSNSNNLGMATAIQSDGKILVLGYNETTDGSILDNDFNLVRYNSNGSLDKTFGNGGIVITNIGGIDKAYSMGIQSDGKILVTGYSEFDNNSVSVLVRYTTNGSLDTTFGYGGSANGGQFVIQNDDKILIEVSNSKGSSIPLTRYTSNGILDTTFCNGNGIATNFFGYSFAIQSDEKILLLGSLFANDTFISVLVRYTSNGSLDSTFGSGGTLIMPIRTYHFDYSIAIQSNGKIVVAYNIKNDTSNVFALTRYTINGILDSTFGNGGTGTTPIGFSFSSRSIAIQSNDKIVVACASFDGDTIALARYNTNGSLDNNFGNSGVISTTIAIGFSYFSISIAIQSDGKILVAGTINSDFGLLRYTTIGILDTSFNDFGIIITNVGIINHNDKCNATAIQSDGKILVAGTSNGEFTLIRYNVNGSLDTTFGIGGIVAAPIYGFSNSIAIQNDGKILMACSGEKYISLIRYNINGNLDTIFGNGGIVTTALSTTGISMAIQSDGKIIMTGYEYNGNYYLYLLRYNTNGTLDNTFGYNGIVTKTLAGGRALAIQSDGKIVVAGTDHSTSNHNFAIVRFTSNGILDNTFGNGGIVTTTFGIAEAIAIQSDGKIVATGWRYIFGFNKEFFTVRYNTNGSLDNTFASGGIATIAISNYSVADAIVIQSDGKIIVGGRGRSANRTVNIFALVRYTTNGSFDGTFGNSGIVTTPVGNYDLYNYNKNSLAIQNDGKIITAGIYKKNNNNDFALLRYHNDNTLGLNVIGNQNAEINIYPNPTQSQININVPLKLLGSNYTVYDFTGKIVFNGKINSENTTVELAHLPSGMYFLRVGDNLKQTFKMIKE
jgi:uncharacterized delta-60 repeat protein